MIDRAAAQARHTTEREAVELYWALYDVGAVDGGDRSIREFHELLEALTRLVPSGDQPDFRALLADRLPRVVALGSDVIGQLELYVAVLSRPRHPWWILDRLTDAMLRGRVSAAASTQDVLVVVEHARGFAPALWDAYRLRGPAGLQDLMSWKRWMLADELGRAELSELASRLRAIHRVNGFAAIAAIAQAAVPVAARPQFSPELAVHQMLSAGDLPDAVPPALRALGAFGSTTLSGASDRASVHARVVDGLAYRLAAAVVGESGHEPLLAVVDERSETAVLFAPLHEVRVRGRRALAVTRVHVAPGFHADFPAREMMGVALGAFAEAARVAGYDAALLSRAAGTSIPGAMRAFPELPAGATTEAGRDPLVVWEREPEARGTVGMAKLPGSTVDEGNVDDLFPSGMPQQTRRQIRRISADLLAARVHGSTPGRLERNLQMAVAIFEAAANGEEVDLRPLGLPEAFPFRPIVHRVDVPPIDAASEDPVPAATRWEPGRTARFFLRVGDAERAYHEAVENVILFFERAQDRHARATAETAHIGFGVPLVDRLTASFSALASRGSGA